MHPNRRRWGSFFGYLTTSVTVVSGRRPGLVVTLDVSAHALTGLPTEPVFFLGVTGCFLQCLEAGRQSDCFSWPARYYIQWVIHDNIRLWSFGSCCGGGAGQQVQVRAFLEELGRERLQWAKQDLCTLAIQHAVSQVSEPTFGGVPLPRLTSKALAKVLLGFAGLSVTRNVHFPLR